jgi:hypothetical protein
MQKIFWIHIFQSQKQRFNLELYINHQFAKEINSILQVHRIGM